MSPIPKSFPLGDVTLQSGATLPDAQITYVTHGNLNAAKGKINTPRPDTAVSVPHF